MSKTMMNPVTILMEKIGLVRPTLAAVVSHAVDWPISGDEDASEFATYEEEVVLFLFQFPSGRREYTVFEYGRCAECKFHEVYLKEALIWSYGGPLPKGAKSPSQAAEVISLKVIKGQA
jgi:hypothetical protein